MTTQTHTSQQNKVALKARQPAASSHAPVSHPVPPSPTTLQRAMRHSGQLSPSEVPAFQASLGNRATATLIQTNLTVGAPNDRYEQEADRVAAQVLASQPAGAADHSQGLQRQGTEELQAKSLAATITPLLQRAPEEEEEVQTKAVQRAPEEEEEVQTKAVQRAPEEEEEVQTKAVQCAPEEEEEVQTKAVQCAPEEEEEVQTKSSQSNPDGGFQVGHDVEARLEAAQGRGAPLSEDVRGFMEPRFGADFSGVRIHTGNEAADLNNDLQARAFTHGKDIYMGAGQYAPHSNAGKELLAHELTHVVQQTGQIQPRVQRWSINSWFSDKGHETITAESVEAYNRMAIKHNKDVADPEQHWHIISKADMQQLQEGARWNDMLGHWGVVTLGLAMGKKSSLAHQSHEGELQFLHGMAANAAEMAWKTQHKIMLWAEFCYKVGAGAISGDTKLKDVQVTADRDFGGIVSIPKLFAKWGEKTVSWLFTEKDSSTEVGQRAMGSMLHMLQDTFCASHTQRVAAKKNEETARKIKGFNVYTEQSASVLGGAFSRWKNRHSMGDKLNEGSAKTTAGAHEALEVGAKVLQFYKARASWSELVNPYLKQVFALTPELEAQKPVQDQPLPEQKRITSASGRLFRSTWLSEQFKKDSSFTFRKRPAELVAIDKTLLAYEKAQKTELDQLVKPLPMAARYRLLLASQGLAENALGLAQDYAVANRDAEDQKIGKRLVAIDKLIAELQLDHKEISLDIIAIQSQNE